MTLFATDRRSIIQNTEIVEFLVNEFVWNNPNCENQISDYVSLFIIFALNQNYDILSILMTSHFLFKCYDVWLDWELIYFHCGYTNFRAVQKKHSFQCNRTYHHLIYKVSAGNLQDYHIGNTMALLIECQKEIVRQDISNKDNVFSLCYIRNDSYKILF